VCVAEKGSLRCFIRKFPVRSGLPVGQGDLGFFLGRLMHSSPPYPKLSSTGLKQGPSSRACPCSSLTYIASYLPLEGLEPEKS
jgi:hypothetical protein